MLGARSLLLNDTNRTSNYSPKEHEGFNFLPEHRANLWASINNGPVVSIFSDIIVLAAVCDMSNDARARSVDNGN